MIFKVDENMPLETVGLLQAAGHEAATVAEEGLSGGADSAIAVHIQAEGRSLITLDLDFSDIRTYPPHDYDGIIVIRSKRQDKVTVLGLVQRVIGLLAAEPLKGQLWIVEADRVRIREASP